MGEAVRKNLPRRGDSPAQVVQDPDQEVHLGPVHDLGLAVALAPAPGHVANLDQDPNLAVNLAPGQDREANLDPDQNLDHVAGPDRRLNPDLAPRRGLGQGRQLGQGLSHRSGCSNGLIMNYNYIPCYYFCIYLYLIIYSP